MQSSLPILGSMLILWNRNACTVKLILEQDGDFTNPLYIGHTSFRFTPYTITTYWYAKQCVLTTR